MESRDLIKHRILFLSGEISQETSNRLISELLLLDADDADTQIDLYINSPGGSILDGLAIIDAMECIRAPVSTICIGQAASMGAWILAAGTKGKRFATPNSEIMIHQASWGFRGQTAVVRVYAERMIRIQDRMVKMLASRTGQSQATILHDMEVECFMTAAEARRYGIVDKIIGRHPKPGNRVPTQPASDA